MKNQPSARDLERVSAYLDNELSSIEKSDFELRLKNEPELSRAKSELRMTRALLRRVPQRRTPRSFAIQQRMVPQRTRTIFGEWSSLNLVSAAATFLLVLVFAGDIWANGLPLASLGAPAAEAPQAFMAQEAASEEPTAGETVLAATPTANAAEDAGQIERFAVPENEIGQKAPISFDLRLFLVDNARLLEFSLAALTIISGGVAFWRRRNPR